VKSSFCSGLDRFKVLDLRFKVGDTEDEELRAKNKEKRKE
jgi:hypothetical protein